jgi:Fe-S-cluster containining protein
MSLPEREGDPEGLARRRKERKGRRSDVAPVQSNSGVVGGRASATGPESAIAPQKLIREIPLIQRFARHNEAEDMRFRHFLKTRLGKSTAETDAVVRRTTDEVWQAIDCTTCGHCCRTLQVVVDSDDCDRLAARLGMAPRQFSQRYVTIDPDRTRRLARSPCPFLGDDNRCTVYEDRPKACRDFPYLHDRHFVARSLTMIENTAACPIVFNVWQALKERLGFRRGAR